MSANTIVITAGRDNREPGENEFMGPEGTYPVILVRVSDVKTELSRNPDAKSKDGTWSFRDWTLAIDRPGTTIDGQLIDIRASTASGPKSKQFGLVAAFVGRTPPIGAEIDIQKHLVGRSALAHIAHNDGGYLTVMSVMPAPQTQAAPVAPAVAPAPQAPAPSADGLPF